MKTKNITKSFLVAALLGATASFAQLSSAYVHKATPASITSSKTILDTAVLNGNANMYLLATHNFNPGGGQGNYCDKKLGFRFQSLKWYLFNQDLTAFTANAHFNIFIPGTDAYSWSHTSSAGNSTLNYTVIDDGRINNNPAAKVFVFDQLGNYNTAVLGVFYQTSSSKWCIFKQAGTTNTMEPNLEFNIVVPKGNTGYDHIVHVADGNNIVNHITYLDHPDLNNNPDAIIFLTQVWNPGGNSGGVYNDHNVGVFYGGATNKWGIYNEDQAAMPLGAAFNVMIFRNSVMGNEEFTIPANQVRVQPNPIAFGNAAEVVLGDVINGSVEISVYDLTGKQVFAEKVQANPATKTYLLPTRDLARGMYVLKVANNGKANAQKLIIQ